MTGEIRIEQTPTRYPGICSSCGAASSSPRKWWLDTGADEKGDLTVFGIMFCDVCFGTFASAAGYVKRGDETEYYLKKVEELEEQVDNLESIRIALNSLGIGIDSLIALSRIALVDIENEQRATPETGSKAQRRTKNVDERKSRPAEQMHDENLGELSSSKSRLDVNLSI